LNAEQRSRQR